jgi:hypothetical protein
MEKKSNRSLNTERVENRNRLSDPGSQHHHLTINTARTKKIRLDELVSKMRSKEDMYELMEKHRKFTSLIYMTFFSTIPSASRK